MGSVDETTKMFRDRLRDCIQGAFLSMAVSTGVKLGIFEIKASLDEPKTSQEIAHIGRFKERYTK